MTASNPCCKICSAGAEDPFGCLFAECVCHKETPAAKFCECKEPLLDSDCGFHPFCHRCGTPIKEAPASIEGPFDKSVALTEEVDKRRQEASVKALEDYLMHQPAKEWWESIDDILRDFCIEEDYKEIDQHSSLKNLVRERLRLLSARIAAQSEKKGREAAVDYIEKHCEGAEYEHGSIWRSVNDSDLAAARSSEESDADKAKRIGHYPDGTGVGWERRYDAPRGEEGKTV